MNASHSTNLFASSFDHICTNGKAPLHSHINLQHPTIPLFALTKGWRSKRQLSKPFRVAIQASSTRLIKPKFWFYKTKGTSFDDCARSTNTQIWKKRIQTIPRALPSSSDVPILLPNQLSPFKKGLKRSFFYTKVKGIFFVGFVRFDRERSSDEVLFFDCFCSIASKIEVSCVTLNLKFNWIEIGFRLWCKVKYARTLGLFCLRPGYWLHAELNHALSKQGVGFFIFKHCFQLKRRCETRKTRWRDAIEVSFRGTQFMFNP